jgi:UDP-N-acetylglucosamine:LPS N-acetylglucosamine transferase
MVFAAPRAVRGWPRALSSTRARSFDATPAAVLSSADAAGPVSLAARSLGVPVALVEPNCAIGLSNLS